MAKKKIKYVTVYYSNGDKLDTDVNPNLTDTEVKEYFHVGRKFNVGAYPKEEITRVKRVVIHR